METLKIGSNGTEVELLQSLLKKLGYYRGLIDGNFGNNTKISVINFQKSNFLNPDGIVGPITWNTLYPTIYGFINYIAKPGDSVYSIANNFNTSVNAILTANPNINSSNLLINSKLIIPIGSVVPTDISYTSKILNMNLYSFKTIYPFLEIGSIGKTVLGRSIPYIKFGNRKKTSFLSILNTCK